MNHKVLVFKDDKSETYGPPFVVETTGMFIRTLQEELPKGQAIWAKHPQDFGVYEIGEWDFVKGNILLHEQKKCLGIVQDFRVSSGVSQ